VPIFHRPFRFFVQAELLCIANNPPASAVDLFCMLEAVDQRFGTEEFPLALQQVAASVHDYAAELMSLRADNCVGSGGRCRHQGFPHFVLHLLLVEFCFIGITVTTMFLLPLLSVRFDCLKRMAE
jgi:hypothetical protein